MELYTQENLGVIGEAEVKGFMEALLRCKAGKSRTDARIIASENWWKLRSDREPAPGGFRATSGWLHNVIVSKHADAVEAYPQAGILPREATDRGEAELLGAVVPCILERNRFEATYSRHAWQKLKTGTGVYKVVWDARLLEGRGDIRVEQVDLLNLYWEPGVTDIQKSRWFFHTELWDGALLEEAYPFLKGKLTTSSFRSARYVYDDSVSTDGKFTVVEVYYRKAGKLHYCRFVENHVLFATENEPQFAQRGLYDHGLYPFVFDPLFPIEGSPCGYGYVDLCRNPQTAIDLLMSAFVENAAQGAKPRYFTRRDGNVNKDQFLDARESLVEVAGNVDEDSIRRIDHASLDGMYVGVYDRLVAELRETSGNTETSTGNVSAGVTAASAIAALQEAAGKGSRDATRSAYRAFSQVVELIIELIRQFYELPRSFRIAGPYGTQRYLQYSNWGLQGEPGKKPLFDIRITAQKKNAYSSVAQNELALQLFKLGFFEPSRAPQAIACLEMMDFDGRDELLQRIGTAADREQKLRDYMGLALLLAEKTQPELAQRIRLELETGAPPASGGEGKLSAGKREPSQVTSARAKARQTSQPEGGGA